MNQYNLIKTLFTVKNFKKERKSLKNKNLHDFLNCLGVYCIGSNKIWSITLDILCNFL